MHACDVQVNDTLLAFARERAFQEDLKRPLVRVALDIWDGKEELHPQLDREAARFDEGVKRVFPRMKAFEKVCDAAKIKFPGEWVPLSLSCSCLCFAGIGMGFTRAHGTHLPN